MWSSFNCKEAFLGLTCDGYDKKRKGRYGFRLALRKFEEDETSENLLKAIKAILDEFKLLPKIQYIITDNGANIKKCMQLLEKEQNLELLELEKLEKEESEDDDVDVDTSEFNEDDFTPSGFNETDVIKRIEELERYYQVKVLF